MKRILAKGSEIHEGFQIVANAPVQAALMIDFSANQETCKVGKVKLSTDLGLQL